VWEQLVSLVDKSLVIHESVEGSEPRLNMLETIRSYARERLEASGEADAVRRRHAAFFLAFAEAAEPKLHGPEQLAWHDRLEAEHGNLRAVQDWAQLEPDGAETTLRLAGALLWYWLVRGYFDEGRRALETGLAMSGPVPAAVRAKALNAAGHLAQYRRDFAHSAVLLEESMGLARSLRDERGAAAALSLLGETARFQGDLLRATELLEESLAIQRRIGDRWGSYHTLYRLGETALQQGQLDRSALLHEEGLKLRLEMNDTRGIGASLKCLGLLALTRREYTRAATFLRDGLIMSRATGNKLGVANCLEGLAAIALADGEPAGGARLLGAIEVLLESIGGSPQWGGRLRLERDLAEARSRLSTHAFEVAHTEGREMSLEHALDYALDAVALPQVTV
jgi:tetratricopeptide (TPR) repeat protein